jgi:HlyD family secretion protein
MPRSLGSGWRSLAWLGFLAGVCVLTACNRGVLAKPETNQDTDANSPTEALMRAPVIKPIRKTLVRYTEQPGQIEAYEQTPIYAKVSGFVTQVKVDIGDRVTGPRYDKQGNVTEPGQVLAQLDVPELQDEHRQKQALEAQTRADVQQADAAIQVAEAAKDSAAALVTEALAAADHDQAEYERRKLDFERVSQLFEDKAITRKAVDEARQTMRAAEAAHREALAKIASAKAVLAEKTAAIAKAHADKASAEARCRVVQADRERIETLLQYAALRAPYDGIIAQRGVDTGHLVPAGHAADKPVFVIVRADLLRIFVDVPEGDAATVQTGSEAQIRISALSGTAFPAQVTRTAWVLNTSTRTLRAEIDVPNPDGRLRPGMYVYARLKVAERQDVPCLPKSAVLTLDGKSFCLQVDAAGKVLRIPVTTGLQTVSEVEITDGLSGDEDIIALNVGAYREGQQVERVPASTVSK